MANIDAIHSFLMDRFSSMAGEIFQFVQAVVLEQHDEIKRTKEENRNLRSMLAEARNNKGSSGTAPLPSRPEGPVHGQHSASCELVDTSLIRVKLEVSTHEPDTEPERTPEASAHVAPPSPKKSSAVKPTRHFPKRTRESESLQMNSYLTINLVPCDAQLSSENLNSSAAKTESTNGGHEAGTKGGGSHCCPYCHKSFDERSLLTSHLESHGGAQLPLFCQICGRHFKSRVTLKNHMIVHQKLRRFRCKFCSKGFHQKGHLKEHERIHTGEKPYGCSICGKHFTQFNHVRVHVRNHHHVVQTPEMPQMK